MIKLIESSGDRLVVATDEKCVDQRGQYVTWVDDVYIVCSESNK